MAMNIHRSDTFQTQNQITLFTFAFDLVSHTPAIFKLIVWWRLWCTLWLYDDKDLLVTWWNL